jgi:hypothetical protein
MSGRSLRFALGVATCVSTVLAAAWWIGADAQTASPPLPSESASAPPQPRSASAVPSAGGSYVVAAPTAYGEQPLLPPIPVAAPPPQTQARLGLRVSPALADRFAPSASGYARVVDPSPLAALAADLEAAAAAAAASQAEAARAQALQADDQIVAAKVAEAAVAQAAADRARLSLLRTRLGLEWGPWLAAMNNAQRQGLVQALARGDAALVRIDGAVSTLAVSTVSIDIGAGGQAQARILGPARTGDPRLQSSGWLAIVRGPAARRLAVGLVLPVQLPTAGAVEGVRLPGGAVLRAEGRSWAYVRTSAGGFERRALTGVAPIDGGLFASGGVRPGENLVVQGASALYTSERAGG